MFQSDVATGALRRESQIHQIATPTIKDLCPKSSSWLRHHFTQNCPRGGEIEYKLLSVKLSILTIVYIRNCLNWDPLASVYRAPEIQATQGENFTRKPLKSCMTIFERYLIFLFLKIFLICFLSFSGLFVIVHFFSNFDELQSLGKEQGSQLELLVEFYGPRLLDLFDRTVSVLILAASVFAFALMQRRRELPAIEAAGISKSRMTRSLLVLSVFLLGLGVVNREYLMPRYREQLTSTAQNWKEGLEGLTHFQKDHLNGLLIRSDQIDVKTKTLSDVVVQIPIHLSTKFSKIKAKMATYVDADDNHKAGLLLDEIENIFQFSQDDNLANADGLVIALPKQTPWLSPNQIFVGTNLTLEELAFGQDLNDYSSLAEMIESLKRPTQWFSRSNRIIVHTRITKPLLDLSLLLFAMPLIIRQSEENIVGAVAICVGSIILFQISVLVCQTLGSLSLIPSASLTAWLPIIAFLPLSAWAWSRIDA